MKILGVDLGTYSIKVAELDANAKGFTLSNFFEFPLSGEPYRDRNLQVIEALRGLSANYDPSSTRWVVGVPQHRLSVHFKRFPFRERPKIQKSLAFELEDEIPLDVDDTIFDFKVVENIGTSADVLTVACPKEAIEEILNISKDCGFDPEIVGVEGLALNNNFQPWNSLPPDVAPALRAPPEPDETGSVMPRAPSYSRLALHIGHSRSLLLVYRDNSLVASRSILWGGADVAAEIAQAFNVPMYEALKVLTERSFILMNSAGATADQVRLSQAVSTQVDYLLRDLKLTLLELKSAFNIEFTELGMSGGACQIQNLGAYLTQNLEFPANVNSEMLSRVPSRLSLTPQIEAVAPVAIGLAIEGMKRPRNPAINLRREEFARENRTLKRLIERWRVPVQIALSAFALFFVYAVIRDQVASSLLLTAEEKVTEAGQKAAGLKGTSATENNIRKYIRAQKTLIANQQALSQLDSYVSAMEILARLAERLPGKTSSSQPMIDVSFFELENDELTIKGKPVRPEATAIVERVLKDVAVPKSFTTATAEPGGFAFKIKVNRKE